MWLEGKFTLINLIAKSVLVSFAIYEVIASNLVHPLLVQVIVIVGISLLISVLHFIFYAVILNSSEHYEIFQILLTDIAANATISISLFSLVVGEGRSE